MEEEKNIMHATMQQLVSDVTLMKEGKLDLEKVKDDYGRLAAKCEELEEKIKKREVSLSRQMMTTSNKSLDVMELSADRQQFLLSNEEFKRYGAYYKNSDSRFTKTEIRDLFNKLGRIQSENYNVSGSSITSYLTEREQEVYKLSFLNESFIIPEYLGLIDCNVGPKKLSSYYRHEQVNSSRFSYIRKPKEEKSIRDILRSCPDVCAYPKNIPLDMIGNWVEGEVLKNEASICFPDPTYKSYFDIVSELLQGVRDVFMKAIEEQYIVDPDIGWLTLSEKGEGFPFYTTSKEGTVSFTDVDSLHYSFDSTYDNIVYAAHPNVWRMLGNIYNQNGDRLLPSVINGEKNFINNLTVDNILALDILPDPTNRGEIPNGKLPSGSFLMVAASWKNAYSAIHFKDLMFVSKDSPGLFCKKYDIGYLGSGRILCPNAARILTVK